MSLFPPDSWIWGVISLHSDLWGAHYGIWPTPVQGLWVTSNLHLVLGFGLQVDWLLDVVSDVAGERVLMT